jgi:DNA modification methylase
MKENPPPMGGSNRYYQHFEYMFILSKDSPKTFNPIIQERRNKHNDKRTHRVKGFTRDKDGNFNKKFVKLNTIVKVGNVWKYMVGGGISVDYGIKHPAVFPEKLANDHIISWSNIGDLVYDPFMGSGTMAKCAKMLGRNWIGSEISKEYCEIAEKRINKVLYDKNRGEVAQITTSPFRSLNKLRIFNFSFPFLQPRNRGSVTSRFRSYPFCYDFIAIENKLMR